MSPLADGERQVAANVGGVRRDHVARYEWAADRLAKTLSDKDEPLVVDAGCGIGYGSKVLAERGFRVCALDRDAETVAFARSQFNHDGRITYQQRDVRVVDRLPDGARAVVAFEVLEHLARPDKVLRQWAEQVDTLVASVPNEDEFPFRPEYAHHMRHYRRSEIEDLLSEAGWRVTEWWGQKGPESEVEHEVNGRTLVVVAEPANEPVPIDSLAPALTPENFTLPGRGVPESVAIVAMGVTASQYLTKAMQAGDRQRFADEVWAINNAGGVIQHDRLFHMDDLQIQRARAENNPEGSVAGVMEWLPESNSPVYTPRSYEWAPASVEYPIEWVLNRTNHCYFNNTVPYAVAFALALGVKEIHLFGCDYSYPDDQAHKREKGRSCLEYWIAVAAERHVVVHVPQNSTLLDAVEKKNGEVLYGYDTEWVQVDINPAPPEDGGGFEVSRVDRAPDDIPTADQMEVRYSHDTRYEKLEAHV